ncbi:MAG: SAM-dependent chlorinase/fluorinase [Dehalococcoidales bacterium]|nr:SAM-dependent chlorinase/fluorinase [Dehalococcoidales bacterium]
MKRKLISFLLLLPLLLSISGCTVPVNPDMPVVLLTDFGTDDYRVPRLKGVIYDTYPEAQVIDATHGIASFDIAAGAYVLGLTAKEFPGGFVFIAAVGAHTSAGEKSLVLTNNKGQVFVAPDNGMLTYIIKDMGVKTVYEVSNQALFDQPISTLSFHYLLGKVGALIASGYNPADIGPAVTSTVMLDIQEGGITDGKIAGSVVFIDHFGNCLTNIPGETLGEYGLNIGDTVRIVLDGNSIEAKYGENYNDVPTGECVLIINSLEKVQLSINKGSFAGIYGVKTGIKVELHWQYNFMVITIAD